MKNTVKELAYELMNDIQSGNMKTEYGEPTAFVYELPYGRYLELTHEQYALPESRYFFSWQIHCNTDEFDGEYFKATNGIIDKTTSDTLNEKTCEEMIEWAITVSNSVVTPASSSEPISLEMPAAEIERLDAIDNAAYQLILEMLNLTEEEFSWSMYEIGSVVDAVEYTLLDLGYRVCRPAIVTETNGVERLERYVEPPKEYRK